VGPVEKRDKATRVDGIQRIGKADVLDAGVGEDFRFTELGAADADRAAADLQSGERNALVRFRMRPQPQASRIRGSLHAIQVALDARLFNEDGRCSEVSKRHAQECSRDNGQLPNGQLPNGQLPNGQLPNGRLPDGHPIKPTFCGFVKPGKTDRVSARPRWPRTTSAKTLRKSVVTSRSLPSYLCSRAIPGQRP
jgi:hypothetical protein